ncbi:helix-turn-helix domain-containing protein [Mucilaginibacter rigui]|uniref:Helix-turn-helix domain-containing protein n=1 Tax=Mucilaginibacter rigui TaxID=534635 RepID=A0ABR7X5S8_9SPHI|nr:helix-turn-helix domain-containing protein [Mucilaginibacter rigui]MBD1385415.1 helix-turn-helix domain-containing protein [Mucilaginibacter rigui]
MALEIITKSDLEEFRLRLLEDIRSIVGNHKPETGKLLKSYQVKNLLKISPGTLQNLRMNGTLPFSKIGGIIYYKYDDIAKILDAKSK